MFQKNNKLIIQQSDIPPQSEALISKSSKVTLDWGPLNANAPIILTILEPEINVFLHSLTALMTSIIT
jgi:hypothetical protein